MSRKSRLKIQEGRLHEFDGQEGGDHYEEKKIGNEWWVKNYNGGTKRWQVSVYSQDSFRRYKSFQDKGENRSEFDYKLNKEQ